MDYIKIFLVFIFLSSVAWPDDHSGCMNFSNYKESLLCKKSEIVIKEIKGIKVRTIHTELGVVINSTDVLNEKDLIATFLDFDSWGKYAQREGSDVLTFKSSRKLKSAKKNGVDVLRHYAYFGTKAPAPLYRQWVRTVINYWEVPNDQNALVTYRFLSDDGINQIEGEKVLIGSEGMRHYEGVMSIYFDDNTKEYIVYTEFWLVPTINILPEFAIPSIERGLVALVKGMFQL